MIYTECNKLVLKQAFEKANDVPAKFFAEIHPDLDSINDFFFVLQESLIECSHPRKSKLINTGTQLKNGQETLELMEDLMEFYGSQWKLHRKFGYEVCVLCY